MAQVGASATLGVAVALEPVVVRACDIAPVASLSSVRALLARLLFEATFSGVAKRRVVA